jgi:serine/threonine protein kinase
MEQEVIVHRTREVIVGDGALREKPQSKAEKPDELVGIMKELEVVPNVLTNPVVEESSQILENVTEEKSNVVGKPAEIELKVDVSRVVEVERGDYAGDWKFIEHVAQGRRCSVDHVVNDSGLEAAMKTLRDVSHTGMKGLRKEAKLIMELSRGGSRYTPQFAISGIYEDKPKIYTEFVPFSGEDLLEGKVGEKNLDVTEKLELFLKMLEPVERLHSKGHVLLDIKLPNYRFRANGEPVFVDFESRRASGLQAISESIAQSMSVQQDADMTPAVMTLAYMAPELTLGNLENVKGREHLCDVYSSGMTLYHLLTGTTPGVNADQISDDSGVVSALGKDKAEKLNQLVMKRVINKDAAKRPQSVKEFADELKKIVGYKEKKVVEKSVEEVERVEKAGGLEKNVQGGTWEVVKESVSTLGKVVGKTVYYVGHVFPGSTHLIPTIFRKALHVDDDTIFPVFFLTVLGNIAYYGCAEGFGFGREALLSAVVGNAISGAYETVRYAKRKVLKRKEDAMIESAKKYGLSVEQIKERMAREKEVLRMLKDDDLSLLIRDGVHRDLKQRKEEGLRIFLEKFGSGPKTEEETFRLFVEEGLAYDEVSTKRAIKSFNAYIGFHDTYSLGTYFHLVETKNSAGQKGFRIKKTGS